MAAVGRIAALIKAAQPQISNRQIAKAVGVAGKIRHVPKPESSPESLRVRLSAWTLLADANRPRKPCARRGERRAASEASAQVSGLPLRPKGR